MKTVRKHPPARVELPCMGWLMAERRRARQSGREVHLSNDRLETWLLPNWIEPGIDEHVREPGILDHISPLQRRKRRLAVAQLRMNFAELGASAVPIELT